MFNLKCLYFNVYGYNCTTINILLIFKYYKFCGLKDLIYKQIEINFVNRGKSKAFVNLTNRFRIIEIQTK